MIDIADAPPKIPKASTSSVNNEPCSKKAYSQQTFFEPLLKANQRVAVYLTNGIRLEGNLINVDDYSLILKDTRVQLIYKHAISSILPLPLTN